jgi:hypothetical protein
MAVMAAGFQKIEEPPQPEVPAPACAMPLPTADWDRTLKPPAKAAEQSPSALAQTNIPATVFFIG